jgi:membrane-bound lytic murein transglycosylase D
MPPELLYLPIIESAYKADAVSRSGAVGIWQIMPGTAHHLGLKVDGQLDERLDFWRATEAALDNLAANHRYFGDWLLALAAYNGGLGRIDRIVEAEGTADFWELRRRGVLPAETADYVPRFLAAAAVASTAGRRGIELFWERSPDWERIPNDRLIDLELLAYLAGLPTGTLRRYNRELLGGVAVEPHAIKVPAAHAAAVRAALADPKLDLIRIHSHVVGSGDTLFGLARRYGTTVSAIMKANTGLVAERLPVGSRVRIPVRRDQSLPTEPAGTPPDPSLYGGLYMVKKGDTLWAISRRHGVRPEDLAAANDLDLAGPIHPGDVLRVPDRPARDEFEPPRGDS